MQAGLRLGCDSCTHHLLGIGERLEIAVHEELRTHTPHHSHAEHARQYSSMAQSGCGDQVAAIADRREASCLRLRGACLLLLATAVGHAAVVAADARAVEATPLAPSISHPAERVHTVARAALRRTHPAARFRLPAATATFGKEGLVALRAAADEKIHALGATAA